MIDNPHVLLPVAYRAAAQVIQCRLLAEEAGERAIHLLTLAQLQGYPPEHPKAWLRSVARRSALALLRTDWARQKQLDEVEPGACLAPYHIPRGAGFDFVRETLEPALSDRQKQALAAAVTCNSTRAAARTCGMKPRDFRRSLDSITRKAREMVAGWRAGDAFADNPVVQFQLGG